LLSVYQLGFFHWGFAMAPFTRRFAQFFLFSIFAAILAGCSPTGEAKSQQTKNIEPQKLADGSACKRTIRARVVALEQSYVYNRYGARNPSGLIYALRNDVVKSDDDGEKQTPIPLEPGADDAKLAGKVQLRSEKRPRPLVLRINEGDCLHVRFTNLLSPVLDGQVQTDEPSTGRPGVIDAEEPRTRQASMHVNGLEYVGDIKSDGANVGRNPSSMANPGETVDYYWYGRKEGGYLFYSMAAPAGGEGDGGQQGLGLFGSINVEPANSTWYRSQVTEDQLKSVTTGISSLGTPIISYDLDQAGKSFRDGASRPILPILDPVTNEIVHSDLNAVIDTDPVSERCAEFKLSLGNSCGQPFREFTVIFHDELTVDQAYNELKAEDSPMLSLRDGMGINYGAAGMGSMVLANRGGQHDVGPTGPAADCAECKLEEFFLSSWVQGDPAMVVERDSQHKAVKALYPDDPSNVHHSYLGDPVRFRNLHAGPKETHVFHLHAHQWLQDWRDENSMYLDSQTISPGASFTYQIHWGGSGNRNLGPGDSIFHCHLYPHFAQGMWELWRTHDVFETGAKDRWLPDAEIAEKTPNPALVPLPRVPLPPIPTEKFRGYPFYIAGEPGHRPPQPPMDAERDPTTKEVINGGLPRHVVVSKDDYGNPTPSERVTGKDVLKKKGGGKEVLTEEGKLYFHHNPGMSAAAVDIANRVTKDNQDPRLLYLASKLTKANMRELPWEGTDVEKAAMAFHAGERPDAVKLVSGHKWSSVGYPTCDSKGHCDDPSDPKKRFLFQVNGQAPQSGAPYADPCHIRTDDIQEPPFKTRTYRAAYVQFDNTVNKYGWHDPQTRAIVLEADVKRTLLPEGDKNRRPAEPFFFRAASDECVDFHVTNLMPSALNVDDFQAFSPTDTIGQHIHLVKFDVTSSDGSANGWNYEDATFSPQEVVERIKAYNAYKGSVVWKPKTHPMFRPGGAMAGDKRGICPTDPAKWGEDLSAPWCGAQTTIQRWWADPLRNSKRVDRTIRTVFTHDHLGPSSHQQHGLYAALVVEPPNATWSRIDDDSHTPMPDLGLKEGRKDGGPTSYAAIVAWPSQLPESKGQQESTREFNLAFADYAPLYTRAEGDKTKPSESNQPLNSTNRSERQLPVGVTFGGIPQPEGISTKDPGGQLINYRNEPIPMRIGEASSSGSWVQKKATVGAECRKLASPQCHQEHPHSAPDEEACVKRRCDQGDMANVFSSITHAGAQTDSRFQHAGAEGVGARETGDPSTPILPAFEGDKVSIRLIQGAQEENHIFTMHGVKWLSQPDDPRSGYRNGQHIGISEHFEFNVNVTSPSKNAKVIDYMYSSSATDNYWDGMWGFLRAFRNEMIHPELRLAHLPTRTTPLEPPPFDPSQGVCPQSTKDSLVPTRIFVVEGHRPDDGLTYNGLFDIHDPNAITFVKTEESVQDPVTGAMTVVSLPHNAGRIQEPLVLRASAGECIHVILRNKLPLHSPDGVEDEHNKAHSWSYNEMPPLIAGFNFNQFRQSDRISLHAQLLSQNTLFDDGAHAGMNDDSTVAPGKEHMYKWYAGDYRLDALSRRLVASPREFGILALQDKSDVIKHASHGAIGAMIVEPAGSRWMTDCEMKAKNGLGEEPCLESAATVTPKDETKAFREFVLLYQNDVTAYHRGQPLPNLRNGDDSEDSGQKGFNYRTEPLWARLGANPAAEPNDMFNYEYSDVFVSNLMCANGRNPPCADGKAPKRMDPATPLFTSAAGMPVRFRIVEPEGHPRNHAFTLFGHNWAMNPWNDDSTEIVDRDDEAQRYGTVNGIGAARHVNLVIPSAGGADKVSGDYMYRSQEGFVFGGGAWGIFRVLREDQCGKESIVKDDDGGHVVCR
jgi:hypothetical protein